MKAAANRQLEAKHKREKGGRRRTHRVVDPPHQHAEDGLARTEQLDFLSNKMLLFRLGLAGADGRGAGGAVG